MSAISPQPKPRREDRRRARFDTSGLMLAKEDYDRDAAFRAYVRGHVCAVVNNDCQGITEHCHLSVGGKGIKCSDYYAAPLCTAHHREAHNVGIITFQLNHGVNLWWACAEVLAGWIRRQR